jgi:hypothetical protein
MTPKVHPWKGKYILAVLSSTVGSDDDTVSMEGVEYMDLRNAFVCQRAVVEILNRASQLS